MKQSHETFILTAEKYGFNSESVQSFRACLQDNVSAYKELYDRKVHEAKQSSMLLCFKPSTLAIVDDEL